MTAAGATSVQALTAAGATSVQALTAGGVVTANAGVTVAANGLSVTAGGVTIVAGGLVLAGGATIQDSGLTVTAGGLRVSADGLTVSAGGMNVAGTTTLVDLVVTGSYTPPSDRRLKTDIVPLDAALDKINKLRGMIYSWIKIPNDKGGMMLDDRRHVGVFAQDVQAILPEAVQLREGFGGTYLAVEYQALIPLLIEAVRELSAANTFGSTARKQNSTEVNVLAATAPSKDVDQSMIDGEEEEQYSRSSSSTSSGRSDSLAEIAVAVKLLQEENKALREAIMALQRDTEQLHRRCDDRMVAAA